MIEKNTKEKLEKELSYKPCCKKIIWSPIVFLVLLVAFIVCSVFFETNVTNEITIVILTILSLLTICSFIIYAITLIKDDCGIRFAKLNELARISEQLEKELLQEDTFNIGVKDSVSSLPEGQKIDINTKSIKNYKFELYKKYMDTLADI